MTDPLVSIVIPCYNGAAFVAEAIESALNQNYPHKEVIVVDDGSTDDSLRVIRSFGSFVSCLTGENAGVAAARNKGAAAARGELLQFLDQDDLLYPHKLERQVPPAVANRPGMVFCDMDVAEFATNEHRGHWGTGSVSTEDPVIHALSTVLQTSGSLHWRESFDRVGGFRADAPPCEDRDLHLRLACAGVSFHHMPERLYVWRHVSTSQSKRDPSGGLRAERRIGEDAYSQLAASGGLSSARDAAFAGYFAKIGRRALRYDDRELAEECFQRAREIHPDGGLPQVYSRPMRTIATYLGPRVAESLIMCKRRLCRNRELA